MQLYFVRHGQSANNLLWATTGSDEGRSADPELTPVGRQQAELVAQFLARDGNDVPSTPDAAIQNIEGFGITHLYSSLMIRSMDTAAAIGRALKLAPVAWVDVHESGGIYLKDPDSGERVGLPGNNRAYLAERFPNFVLPDDLDEQGWWNRPFEEQTERPLRARRFLTELEKRHSGADDRVAVVSHGGFYNHFMATLLDIPPEETRRATWFGINNTAITRIDFLNDHVRIAYHNRVDFLPPALIT